MCGRAWPPRRARTLDRGREAIEYRPLLIRRTSRSDPMPFSPAVSGALFAQQAPSELFANPVQGVTNSLALVLGAAGAAVILWGAYSAAVRLLAAEMAAPGGPTPAFPHPARPAFSAYLLAGLEFLIAGYAIKLVGSPDWHQVAVLCGLALARVSISLGLKWAPAPPAPARAEAPEQQRLAAPAEPPKSY